MYTTIDKVQTYLTLPMSTEQEDAMNMFLEDWAVDFDTICELNGIDVSTLSTLAIQRIEIDCRNNAKDWYYTIGKDLSINYTTLSTEGFSEAFSNSTRTNADFFKISPLTMKVIGIQSGVFSISVRTVWGCE